MVFWMGLSRSGLLSRLLVATAIIALQQHFAVQAVTPAAHYGGGGLIVTGQDYPSTLDDLQTLDLSNDLVVSKAGGNWIPVEAKGPLQAAPNFLFVMTAVPQNKSFVMNGGLGFNNQSALVHQTIAFDTSTETWKAIDSGNMLQTRQSTMILGSNNIIYIWGGNSDIFTGYAGENYATDMKILNYMTSSWNTAPLTAGIPPRIEHSGTLSTDGKTIIYLGGLSASQIIAADQTVQYQVVGAPMSSIVIYDTEQAQWTTKQSSGPTPTNRRLHAAALIPNTTTIVLYGGAEATGDRPASDYCYLLDTNTLGWQQVTFNDDSGAGPRYGHSLVLIGADSLFVLFGIDNNGATRNDFNVLNVTSWTWMDDFQGIAPTPSGSPSDPSSSIVPSSTANDNDDGSGLSGGAIAGAVIGVILGIALIAGIVYLLIRRKRQQQQSVANDNDDQLVMFKNEHGDNSGQMVYNDTTTPPPPVITKDNDNTQAAFFMASSLNSSPAAHKYQVEGPPPPPVIYTPQHMPYSDNSSNFATASLTSSNNISYFQPSSISGGGGGDRSGRSTPVSPEKPDGGVPRMKLTAVKPDGA
ncbi:hypothetical protein BDB00DRAFT_871362 [Zychaea mexicana]|uniref:uncharacterized protein n=1 Tax=Zychaea mexicana TaxID=64656 RepID=UPI0022FF4391|nr:uncharacterized protein BDB00DRAFT_871362 [Zychaea mexicana]KAI9494537.1 hypothetical protein BDB00DRAFT_871362 [Zychaea mexicana]